MNKIGLVALSTLCVMTSISSKGADQPDGYSAPMVIPKNAALLEEGAKMPALDLKTLKDAFNRASARVRFVSKLSRRVWKAAPRRMTRARLLVTGPSKLGPWL